MFWACISALFLSATAADRFVLEARHRVPTGWIASDVPPATQVLPFVVGLAQRNLDVLDAKFWAISTPGTPEYGKFMTMEEMNELVASQPSVVEAAMAAMTAEAGISCTHIVDALRCKGTVAAIETVFGTRLHVFTHTATSSSIIAYDGSLTLPRALEGVVEVVEGFSTIRSRSSNDAAPRGRPLATVQDDNPSTDDDHKNDYLIVPETLVGMYSLGNAVGNANVMQAAVEFVNESSYTPAELGMFATSMSVPAINVAKILGPFSPDGDLESSLDVQYLATVGKGNTNWFVTEVLWMYSFVTQFATIATPPSVISMSYAWWENDQCEWDSTYCTNSHAYIQRVNVEFQKLGARGVTLLAATGDNGAHGRTDIDCGDSVLRPVFPASSQYVTAVGATMIEKATGTTGGSCPVCEEPNLVMKCALSGTEIVASYATGAIITSGGGFSNVIPRPSYQDTVVQQYLSDSSALPAAGNFNSTGRGYPDVSALGHNYFVYAGGEQAVDGTSCSTPVWAGIIGLINAELAAAGATAMGFANPTLYQIAASHPNAFHDITSGGNTCTSDVCNCSPGFQATTGWDAVTGLGTPVYAEIVKAVKTLKGVAA